MRIHVSPDSVRDVFAEVSDHPAFVESADAVARGHLPAEMIQAMTLRPEFLPAFADLSAVIYTGGIVERDVKELIILESSRVNQCQFCANAHIAIARALGISDMPMELIADPDRMNDRQRLAVRYTHDLITDSNHVSDALFVDLRLHFTDAEIVEITLMIGYINMLNLFNNSLRVTYRSDYEPTQAG